MFGILRRQIVCHYNASCAVTSVASFQSRAANCVVSHTLVARVYGWGEQQIVRRRSSCTNQGVHDSVEVLC
jgi:hypothetical protein